MKQIVESGTGLSKDFKIKKNKHFHTLINNGSIKLNEKIKEPKPGVFGYEFY